MSGSHSDDEDEQETWFAGGERSGISVQNPNRARVPGGNLVRDLLQRAEEEGAAPDPDSVQGRTSVFSGGGHTLGGEGVQSAYVPGANEGLEEEGERVTRNLTFWREGFTVEDGPLMRYDDPQHADVLAAIHAGHAPPSILNVRIGQRVDVQVTRRTDDDYVPPKPKPFSGQGTRLGAAIPGSSSTSASSNAGSSTTSARAPAGASSITPRFEVDQNLPTTSVRVTLADGTRIVCRMNLTHTVGDLRNFINAASPVNLSRPYTIGTTFPNRVLSDDTATIEGEKLQNSVVVMRWL
ncbi:SEP-domain-containing protein [Mycena alexandri]|uniref:SEP-domain-containing protein n=1 Tax=Mycena alexandri TaxID=1745969 RepID=A0AAD6WTR4_9AGAR|nr:SEP-domain-containing protein [Mycena alexandri]